MVCLHRLPVKAHPRKSAEKILISIFTTSWAQRRALQLPFNSPFPLRPRSLAPPGHLKSRWLKSLALPTTDPPVVAYNTMKDWQDVLPTLIGEPLQVPIKFIWLIKGSRCAYVVQRACVVSGIFENVYATHWGKNQHLLRIWCLKIWILWKMIFWKCEFCEKWEFEIVNFVKIEIFKMWIFG